MAQTSAGEKTEKATSKKRKDARAEGQVLKSTEVNTAFCSLVMFAFMSIFWTTYIDDLLEVFTSYLSTGALQAGITRQISVSAIGGLYTQVLNTMVRILLPLFGVAMAAGLISNLLQVGFLFTSKAIKPKLSRINPMEGFKRIFSSRTLVDLLKSILKIILLGYILYSEYSKLLDTFGSYMGLNLYDSIIQIMQTAFSIAIKMCMALVVVAAFDFLFQWRKHEKDLMMTKQEVKDEYKNTEGDPQIKSRIRQRQRQMSSMRMIDAIPGADVVITNPTHFAVALRYKQGDDDVPVVVAKGQDYLAQKIKQIAIENSVEIVENKPLAQSLYKLCEVDAEIPAELYQAVADVLVYVFRRRNSLSGRRP